MVLNELSNKIKEYFRHKKIDKIRKYALQYIFLIDTQMKAENTKRPIRRQFWRELVKQGRFYNGGDNGGRKEHTRANLS